MNPAFHLQITASVNAGVCLTFPDGKKVWIDFFPDGKTPLFSHVSDSQWEQIKKDPRVTPPDLILFSHTHPDHFSAARVQECAALWPDVPVYFPAGSNWRDGPAESELAYQPISGEEIKLSLGKTTVRMIRTVHSGKEYVDVPHYSFLFTCEGRQIFVAADALVTGEKLCEVLEYSRTDLAVLTFPWASTSVGRERVEYMIQPSHVLLYHIPNREDDRSNFRKVAASGKEQLDCPDVRAITEPFQTEVFKL